MRCQPKCWILGLHDSGNGEPLQPAKRWEPQDTCHRNKPTVSPRCLVHAATYFFRLESLAFEMLCLHHDSPIRGLPLACFAVQHTSSLLGYLTRCRADIPQVAWQVIARDQTQIGCRYPTQCRFGFAWVKATYVHDEPHPNPVPSSRCGGFRRDRGCSYAAVSW